MGWVSAEKVAGFHKLLFLFLPLSSSLSTVSAVASRFCHCLEMFSSKSLQNFCEPWPWSLCNKTSQRRNELLILFDTLKTSGGGGKESSLNSVCMSLEMPTFAWRWSPLIFNGVFYFSFCFDCKALRRLSMYIEYTMGCYVYSTLSVQSLSNQNQSCLLILVSVRPCVLKPGSGLLAFQRLTQKASIFVNKMIMGRKKKSWNKHSLIIDHTSHFV